jgi:hypothetical protein
VGQGIGSQRAFLGQTNPRTGESDGAILLVVYKTGDAKHPTVLLYAGSDAQNKRHLSRSDFAPGSALFELAAAPMREKRNVVGAIEGTVNGIDARLNAAIDAEQAPARRAEKTQSVLVTLAWIMGLLTAAGGALALGLKAGPDRRLAVKKIAELEADLQAKFEATYGGLSNEVELYLGPISGPNKIQHTGKVAALETQLRDDMGAMTIYSAAAQKRIAEARAALGKNPFSGEAGRKAQYMLSSEPIVFKPEDGVALVAGAKQRDWRDELLGKVTDYQAFSMSFDELMAAYQEGAERVVSALDQINAEKGAGKATGNHTGGLA